MVVFHSILSVAQSAKSKDLHPLAGDPSAPVGISQIEDK